GPDTDRRALGEEGTSLVGLVEAPLDDHALGRWLEREGQPAGRLERGRRGEPFANERKLEDLGGTRVHVVAESAARARTRKGGAAGDDEPPRLARPRLACVTDTDPRRCDDLRAGLIAATGLESQRRLRIAQVDA